MAMRLGFLGVLAALAVSGPAWSEPSPLGMWERGDGEARVRIEPCDRAFCAINTWIRPGTQGEKVGDRLVLSVAPSTSSSLTGVAFDPQRGLNYSIRMEVGANSMSTRGCWFVGMLCKTMTWTRLSAAE